MKIVCTHNRKKFKHKKLQRRSFPIIPILRGNLCECFGVFLLSLFWGMGEGTLPELKSVWTMVENGILKWI